MNWKQEYKEACKAIVEQPSLALAPAMILTLLGMTFIVLAFMIKVIFFMW